MTLRIFESIFYKSLIRACSFDNSLAASQNARSYVQTIDQVRCEPFKTTAKFQWFWILYVIISFFSYTRTAIQITTGVYVVRYWMIICAFSDRRFRKKQTLVCQVTNKLNERVEKTGGYGTIFLGDIGKLVDRQGRKAIRG